MCSKEKTPEEMSLHLRTGEDYDAVPVVGGIRLGCASFGFGRDAVSCNSVIACKDIGNSLSATL